MTSTIAVTNGVGVQTGNAAAYDRASTFAIAGLASEFYSVAVTGTLTTADGATALADDATGTVSAAGAVSLAFDLDTDAIATIVAGRSSPAAARLTVYADATGSHACVAAVHVRPAAAHGVSE